MKIINKTVAFWYVVVISTFALIFVVSLIYQLNQPYTGQSYIMQDGE